MSASRYKWPLFVFSLIFLISPIAGRAATLQGTILDPDGAEVPGATVLLLGSQGTEIAHTATSERGQFRFQGIASGAYTVKVSLAGFGATTATARAGETLRLVLPLAPVHERVVVTATRTAAATSQLGASTSVITRSQIVGEGTPLVSDLLQSLPGITVARNGPPGGVTSVFARGGESDYNKVLLDGAPLNLAGGALDFNTLTTGGLERVEVVRSADSALFGSDAMTSVIQLFARQGNAETRHPHFSFSGEGGKDSTWAGDGSVSGGYGPFDYMLEGGKFSTDNQAPNDFFHVSTLSANFGLRLGKATTLRAIMMGGFGLAGTPGQTAFGPPITDASYRHRTGYGVFMVHNQTTPSLEQQLTYTFSKSRQVSVDLGQNPPFTPSFEGRTAAFQFFDFPTNYLDDEWRDHVSYQTNWEGSPFSGRFGQHVDTFAFDWDGEHGFLVDRFAQDPATRARRNNFGYTFQDQTLWGRVSLANGVRIDDNGSFGTVVVPRSSLAYQLRNGRGFFGATTLKFNFGLGVKEPSFQESYANTPFFVGNPNLAPERTRTLDYGVEQRFWNGRGRLELDGFDNLFRDQIAFEVTDFQSFSGTYFNIGRASAKGGEVSLEVAPMKGLRAIGSYTYLDSEVIESGNPTTPALEAGSWLLRRPRHSGSIQILWNWRRMNVTSTTVLVGRRQDSDFVGLVPPLIWNSGYTDSNLSWSFRAFGHITYFGTVGNLFNQEYMQILGYPALKLTWRAGMRLEF
ncbi:MAG TPA: TonB-dependent receptor plug domain-containing protein [Terriglobia bacterium]|nr:TonB-dependent receptor plug domain-containing protein [Terriglobia bacterium]